MIYQFLSLGVLFWVGASYISLEDRQQSSSPTSTSLENSSLYGTPEINGNEPT